MMGLAYMRTADDVRPVVSFQASLTVTYERRMRRVNRDSVYGVELRDLPFRGFGGHTYAENP